LPFTSSDVAGFSFEILMGIFIMKLIPLTHGKFAQVDDDDYEWLSQFNWCVQGNYAARAKSKKRGEKGAFFVFMHRAVMGLGDKRGIDRIVDHINRNSLDNRKENLRICTQSENLVNSRINNKFGYKGVVKFACGKYQAMIWNGKKNLHLGNYSELEDAARAYDAAAKMMHGEFASLNFP